MQNRTEYIMIKQLTAKQNRRTLVKIVLGGMGWMALAIASLYFMAFFLIWANEITDKILGL